MKVLENKTKWSWCKRRQNSGGVEGGDDAHHTCASEVPFSEPPRRKMSVQRCTVESWLSFSILVCGGRQTVIYLRCCELAALRQWSKPSGIPPVKAIRVRLQRLRLRVHKRSSGQKDCLFSGSSFETVCLCLCVCMSGWICESVSADFLSESVRRRASAWRFLTFWSSRLRLTFRYLMMEARIDPDCWNESCSRCINTQKKISLVSFPPVLLPPPAAAFTCSSQLRSLGQCPERVWIKAGW